MHRAAMNCGILLGILLKLLLVWSNHNDVKIINNLSLVMYLLKRYAIGSRFAYSTFVVIISCYLGTMPATLRVMSLDPKLRHFRHR